MITVGVDPDLHFCSLAVVEDGRPVYAYATKVKTAVKGVAAVEAVLRQAYDHSEELRSFAVDRICVEGQQVYEREKRKGRPEDLIKLAHVAGGMAYELLNLFPRAKFFMPLPQEWKGSIPKEVHQARIKAKILQRQPSFFDYADKSYGPTHVSHIIDAVGLGLWVADKRVLSLTVE